MQEKFYKIHSSDNVLVNLKDNMKYANRDIVLGEKIIKYGFAIGVAKENIKKGELVHTHNIKSLLEGADGYIKYQPYTESSLKTNRTFLGYKRANGSVGIRNDIFIIPTVGCVNGICENLSKRTGAIALTHPYGCSQLGEDHDKTREILKGLALHPNAGGVLIVSLGCENNTLESFIELLDKENYDKDRVKFMTVQKVEDELTTGLSLIEELKKITITDKREECNLSSLIIGLKCGGSDGLSGITANPLVGAISDKIIGYNGSSVLTEVPEMFGAEDVLLSRCATKEIYDSLVKTVNDFKSYYITHGERIDENPSPGNKAGGISTLAEKSLGCVQKGGTTQIVDVISYGERVKKSGLTVLNGPGNDIVACTALAAAKAQIILFTTGRGTPLGGAVPVVKISTNTALSQKKSNWIDFDAGKLLNDDVNLEDIAGKLFDKIIKIAEGELTKAEKNQFHEIAIWKNGVTL